GRLGAAAVRPRQRDCWGWDRADDRGPGPVNRRGTSLLPPLLAAAALLIGGAVSYAEEQVVPGVALLAAGLVVLGAWVGEAVRWRISDDMEAHHDRKDPTG